MKHDFAETLGAHRVDDLSDRLDFALFSHSLTVAALSR
jgi:hypothetical protein